MRIDDLIVLGRTTPVKSKKYGHCVCVAGYSEELRSFVRIYPTKVRSKVKALHRMVVEVERRKGDARLESWALKDRTEDSILSIEGPVSKNDIRPFLDAHTSTVPELNRARRSLGIIRPMEFDIVLERRGLFESAWNGVRMATNFPHEPRVIIPACKGEQSRFMLSEWGVYELMRKYEDTGKQITAEAIEGALHVRGKDTYFLVGNLNNVKNRWLVIKAFTYDKGRVNP